MYQPTSNDEITGLVSYLDQQLSALRASAVGLTDDQMRQQPCRSVLSIGGLIKHVTYGMRGATQRLSNDGGPLAEGLTESGYADYMGSFALADDETAEGAVADFDSARVDYLAAVAATDPAASTVEPPQPWYGIYDARPANARFYLVHQIEEMARHAGHADIIREQLDGVAVPQIELTLAGFAGNDFFQPYVAEPGTIGAGAGAGV